MDYKSNRDRKQYVKKNQLTYADEIKFEGNKATVYKCKENIKEMI
jgi:hypothetical protein